jgi:adenine deaminase
LAEALKRGKPVCGHIYGRDFVAAGAASGITDTHESIDREIANDFLENGLWIFLRGGNPTTPWHSLPQAIKAVTELGANPKRVCVCTDDRDADDLFLFGMDWVVRQAVAAGLPTTTAWSMGSLHPATRYAQDGDFGGLGPARRADLVLLNDALEVQNTWYGGELVVERKKITPLLEQALSKPYRYPRAAYATIMLPKKVTLVPPLPTKPVTANVIRVVPPGIVTAHDRVALALYRITEQVLQNALKHGQATQARVDVQLSSGSTVLLNIAADGTAPAAGAAPGNGTAIINAWLDDVGGQWGLLPADGGGSRFRATLGS